MSEQPTPRTDANALPLWDVKGEWVRADFARQLERELGEAKKRLSDWHATNNGLTLKLERDRLKAELIELKCELALSTVDDDERPIVTVHRMSQHLSAAWNENIALRAQMQDNDVVVATLTAERDQLRAELNKTCETMARVVNERGQARVENAQLKEQHAIDLAEIRRQHQQEMNEQKSDEDLVAELKQLRAQLAKTYECVHTLGSLDELNDALTVNKLRAQLAAAEKCLDEVRDAIKNRRYPFSHEKIEKALQSYDTTKGNKK